MNQKIKAHELKELFEQEASNVIEDISPEDIQYKANPDRSYYFSAGQSALRCIKLAMLAAGKEGFKSILDLPCGHGRVLRTLKAAFAESQLVACDIDRGAVDFCAKVIGAAPVYSEPHPEQIRITAKFELIWCGSLLTHLNAARWTGFLSLFNSLLEPGGILVFTTHGQYVSERLQSGNFSYGLTQNVIDEITKDYRRDGFGYGDYPNQSNYGISLSYPPWVCAQLEEYPNLQLLNYTERGWNRHQDVIACIRVEDKL